MGPYIPNFMPTRELGGCSHIPIFCIRNSWSGVAWGAHLDLALPQLIPAVRRTMLLTHVLLETAEYRQHHGHLKEGLFYYGYGDLN